MSSVVPEPLRESWGEFTAAVETRLEAGAREYGATSLMATPRALANEVRMELLDVMGWGFLLWRRMGILAEGIDMARGKFVQTAVAMAGEEAMLTAVDDTGRAWVFDSKEERWLPLPPHPGAPDEAAPIDVIK